MSTETPVVTVIVATYNSRATLRHALQSMLAQEFTDFEALIVGDGCTDGSEEEVRKLADVRLHWINLFQNRGGQWRPNNEGFRNRPARSRSYTALSATNSPDSRQRSPLAFASALR